MNDCVTLNQLLNVCETMKLNAGKYQTINMLLDEIICDRYDIVDMKDKLTSLFSFFKSARYLYDFPIEDTINTGNNLDPQNVSFTQRRNASQLEEGVQRYLDQKIKTTDVYYSLMNISYKLTGDEVVYLTNAFFKKKSEEDIAEIIGISKTYLQKIKKSCIVKMWVDLEEYCKKDD